MGKLGKAPLFSQVTSPAKSYTAILIDSDQGILGGNTLVNAEYHASEINIGLGRLVKAKNLYIGEWGEFEMMTLEWKDEHTLLINGRSYRMN